MIRVQKQLDSDKELFSFQVLSSGVEIVKSSDDDYTQKHNAEEGIVVLAKEVLIACGFTEEMADKLSKDVKWTDWSRKQPPK